ncbi:MAG: hypothetical protein HPZ97_01185 [Oscillospiraceae bacterium]|nr:hypothetical protein [Oscillospiraceae bacterium]
MKRFFAILIVLAACLALFCVTAGAEDIPNDVTWEEISSESQLRALEYGTHYAKVTQSFEVSTPSNIFVYGDLTLDLNGCTITLKSKNKEDFNGYAMFVVGDDTNKASFTLMDSSPAQTGKLTFAYLGDTYQEEENGQTVTKTCRAGAVSMKKGSAFTMKSGTIDRFGGTYTLSVINLGRPNTTFNMEGGVIQNCTTPNDLGGIAVGITSSGNTFNMTGGEIKNCETGGSGVIYASNATVHIGGNAKITNNKSGNGGAFYVKNDTRLTIDGNAVIEGNEGSRNGGAIYACVGSSEKDKPSSVEIGGSAKISGNKASGTYSYGGAVYAENAAITMTGGTIENNGAQNGGNELFLIGSTTFTMRGGKLRHTIDAAAWRTVSLRSSAKLSISDGEIELLNEPYAMELRDTAKLTATGGTVIASGTIAAFDLVSTADVDPEKAATFAGADAETAEFITYPNLTTYAGSKYIKLVPGWKLTLDSNGHGTNPDPIIVPKNYGAKLPMLDDTDGYVCTGWYYDAACTRAYAMEKITADTTLYAGWVQSGSFGLSFSGVSQDTNDVWYLTFDPVTYGTEEWGKSQTKTFTITNTGAVALNVELENKSGGGILAIYFEKNENSPSKYYVKSAVLKPGASKLVYMESEGLGHRVGSFVSASFKITAKDFTVETHKQEYLVGLKWQRNPAIASLDTPELNPNTFDYGTTLGEIELPEGWSWVDSNDVRLPVGTTEASARYTLSDNDKKYYDWSNVEGYDAEAGTVTRDIALKIEKGDAAAMLFSCTLPTDLIYDGTPKEAVVTALEAPAGYAPYTGTFTVLYNGSATPPTDAGTYQVSISGSGDNCYRSFTALRDENWTFTISPASVTPPTAVTGLVYNGETQTGVVLPENALFTLTGNTAKNAGEYTATASLLSKRNYVWSDGTSDDKRIEWSIARASVTPPAAVTGLVYNGETQTGVVLPENALFTLTGNTAKNAGEYTATASLVSKQNYVWADGTSDDKQIAWSIAKAVLSDITVLMESFAQGKTPSTPALSANPDHAAVRFYYSTRNLNSGGTLWSAEKGKTLSVGVHYIYAELDESENYLAYTTVPTSFVVYTLATGERIRISETKHGYVQAPPSAMPGTAVPVAAEPDKGYVLGSLRVTDESGRSISVTEKADGTYFFIMPDSTAYIDAEFVGNMPFVDVPASAWYADAVRDAWANGLIDGVNATHFEPDGSLTVAQAIKLAAALHQRIENGTVTLKNGSPWYRSYLEYAVEHGVIEESYLGYSAAALNAPIQRAEFAHILYGAAKPYAAINEIGANALPDVKTGDRYADEIYALYRAGVLNGSDRSGTFYPTSLIRRSEAAAILIRAFDEEARKTLTLQ